MIGYFSSHFGAPPPPPPSVPNTCPPCVPHSPSGPYPSCGPCVPLARPYFSDYEGKLDVCFSENLVNITVLGRFLQTTL